MNYILFDDSRRDNLLPLTFVRPVADIRIGILTIREKWEQMLGATTSTLTEEYLSKKYPLVRESHNILINASILPDERLVEKIHGLKPNQALVEQDCILAMHLTAEELDTVNDVECEEVGYAESYRCIRYAWDIINLHDEALRDDFALITKGKTSAGISPDNTVIDPQSVFVEEGATIRCSILNASTGPIYVGKEAEIQEGSLIRGPFTLCDHAVLKMGTKVYGPATIGPYSKAGGEISHSILFSYSNKAHDGFLGHSVIGEWCNLGAATNNSNLKNNYEPVKMWSYPEESFIETGMQFCGLIMGDYTKTGINTMFNTGTVVGVNSNIFGSGFQRNFIPSFAWGGTTGFKEYKINQAIKAAERMHERRQLTLSEVEREILRSVYEISFKYRRIF